MSVAPIWSLFSNLVVFLLLITGIACGSSAPREVSFNLVVHEDALQETELPLKVSQDDMVTMVINSDKHGTFHLHGYDIEKEITAGGSATLNFQATATGSFPFTFHNSSGGHDHDGHEKSMGLCEAAVPVGMLIPTLELIILEPPSEQQLRIRVDVDNFVLSTKSEDTGNMLSGHWHLFVDDQLVGMFTTNEIVIPAPDNGLHQLTATLTDNLHCSYGIGTSTAIELGSHTKENHSPKDLQSMMGTELELGRIEVHPS